MICPGMPPHGLGTQLNLRTDSYDLQSLTQAPNIKKSTSNMKKIIIDGVQNFQPVIFDQKCWIGRLDLSINQNLNLFYSLIEVILIFGHKFGA